MFFYRLWKLCDTALVKKKKRLWLHGYRLFMDMGELYIHLHFSISILCSDLLYAFRLSMMSLNWDRSHHLKAWVEGKGDKNIAVEHLLCQAFSILLFAKKLSKYVYQLNHRETFYFLDRNVIDSTPQPWWRCINWILPLKWAVVWILWIETWSYMLPNVTSSGSVPAHEESHYLPALFFSYPH